MKKMRRNHWLSLSVVLGLAFFLAGPADLYALGHGDADPLSIKHIPGTVLGCDTCHDFEGGYYESPSMGNLRWLKDSIEWPPDSGNFWDVLYRNFDSTGTNAPAGSATLSDGNPALLDGPCEVCHVTTAYHTNPVDDGLDHYDGERCTTCHPHFLTDITDYFEVRFVGGQSHETHLASYDDPKGPYIEDCDYCHLGTSDYSIFADNQPLETTTVCNTCHSPNGVYDGVGQLCEEGMATWPACESDTDYPKWVAYGAKFNWETAIYNEEKGDSLKDGKKKWCVGCHDEVPSVINTVVKAVSAPKVAGDGNPLYGYWQSGHGRASESYANGLTCGGTDPEYGVSVCHDLQARHIDGVAKTFEVNETTQPPSANSYRDSYRLAGRLDVPRVSTQIDVPGQYQLCTQCHTEVFGVLSNYRFDKTEIIYLHTEHMNFTYPQLTWDSDNDGVRPAGAACIDCAPDSAMTCPTCHNPHGTRMDLLGGVFAPGKVMVRDGWLTGTRPGLDFRWYDAPNGIQGTGSRTSVLAESLSGELWAEGSRLYNTDPSCSWQPCHVTLPAYNRDPFGPVTLTVDAVWFTDLSDVTQTVFAPGEDIRIHVNFSITGSGSYYVKLIRGTKTNKKSWINVPSVAKKRLDARESFNLPAGTYLNHWQWDLKVDSGATAGEGAARTLIRMFDTKGGNAIVSDAKIAKFTVQP